MLRLAIKHAWFERTRFWLGISAVAAAVALIATMQAIFAGFNQQLTKFVEVAGADLWVAQKDVSNFYLANSVVPVGALEQVSHVSGVQQAMPVLLFPISLKLNSDTINNWLMGIPQDAPMGGPWLVRQGAKLPRGEQVILDDSVTKPYGLGVSDKVALGGQDFVIGGVAGQTSRMGSAMIFMDLSTARANFRLPDQTSWILVKVRSGESVELVRRDIQNQVEGIEVWTVPELVASDRKLNLEMGGNILQLMTLIALVIGFVSVSLTVFVTVIERLRDYAVLKAVGCSSPTLLGMVLNQALTMASLGWMFGSFLVVGMAPVANAVGTVLLVLTPESLLSNLPVCLAIGLVASLPAWLTIARAKSISAFH